MCRPGGFLTIIKNVYMNYDLICRKSASERSRDPDGEQDLHA
jgi:hypothetical protein